MVHVYIVVGASRHSVWLSVSRTCSSMDSAVSHRMLCRTASGSARNHMGIASYHCTTMLGTHTKIVLIGFIFRLNFKVFLDDIWIFDF